STPVYYFAGQSGIYTNFEEITVDASEGINILSYSGSSWSKAVVPIELSGYTSLANFLPVKDAIDNILEKSYNLIDPDSFQSGTYLSTDGSAQTTSNVLRTELMDVSADWIGKEATLSGSGAAGAGSARILIKGPANENLLIVPASNSVNPISFVFPVGSSKIGFVVASGTGIGD